MITKNELNIANNSYTKKDFYQIYPEILDLVSKITERWDPASSNESDPGVVLLKLLAFIADKNIYNIDKNILECFMPSATQPESMRKLCDMMGYDMHYYKSATTTITFMWSGDLNNEYIYIPRFTAITSTNDDNIKYITTQDVTLLNKGDRREVTVIQGVLNDLTAGDSKVIKLYNLDDNNRIYLPEQLIAENGVFVDSTGTGKQWHITSNLYTQVTGSYVYKFGYDSSKKLPYIEFPQDIDQLIGDGLEIRYVRTTGVEGNIKAKTLDKIASIANVKLINESNPDESRDLTEDDEQYLILANLSATISGQDVETIDEAYNSFKKTVGTFDTLVTCRDYANAIYNLVDGGISQNPLVSNCQVSDIRDELSRSCRIMTFNDFGVCFKQRSLKDSDGYDVMQPFDIYIYPFKAMTGSYDASNYNKSFSPDLAKIPFIENEIEELKTISHNINPIYNADGEQSSGGFRPDDLFAIKNIYKLSAKINTTYKVNTAENKQILENISEALYKKFNCRNVDFGEDLVYDEILETIQNADSRIKTVALDDPELTPICLQAGGTQLPMFKQGLEFGATIDDDNFISLIVKNILAGRLRMFKYTNILDHEYGQQRISGNIDSQYGNASEDVTHDSIISVSTALTVSNGMKLKQNENIIFVANSYVDDYIYSYGVLFNWNPQDASLTLSPNQQYKLTGTDTLYIWYTDLNDREIFRKYYATGYDEWWNDGGQAILSKSGAAWSGIIRCDALLAKSGTAGAKNKPEWIGSACPDSIKFSMINTDNQIGVMKQQKDVIPSEVEQQSYYPIYWITRSGKITGTHVLEDGEYFFMTDVTKTSLVSYGPGTRIRLVARPGALEIPELSDEDYREIDIDKIANEGLAAFDNLAWYNYKPTEGATDPRTKNPIRIEIEELRIVTLGEGCELVSISSSGTIGNEYVEVSDATYVIDEVEQQLPKISSNNQWYARSRLNLNVGPKLTQYLDPSRHSFIIHFKADPDVDLLSESSVGEIGIRCNYLIQETADDNGNIGLQIYKEDSSYSTGSKEIDDLILTPFKEESCVDNNGNQITFNNFSEYYTALKVDQNQLSVTLPISIPSGSCGLLFVYYKNGSGQSGAYIRVDKDLSPAGLYIEFYNNTRQDGSGDDDIIKYLQDGLNIFKIDSPADRIIIHKADDDLVIFSSLSIISSDYEGLDLEHLGCISTDSTVKQPFAEEVLDRLNKFGTTEFCYNAHLDNDSLIDYETLDPGFWTDPNNIVRKFVLSQIDSDLSGVKLNKSSRL